MKKLQRLRQQKGHSIRRLAKASGLHWTTVWKIETGLQEPTVATLRKLARALGVDVADLL